MSKPVRLFSYALLAHVLAQSASLYAQQTVAVLKISNGPTPSVAVTLDTGKRRQLSFLRSVAGTVDLPRRITNLKLFESSTGPEVAFRELVPGEYVAEREFSRATYEIDLSPTRQRSAAAHASWQKDNIGILMLSDLLPQATNGPVDISVTPDSPPLSSIEIKPGERTARVNDVDDAILLVGNDWRMRKTYRCWECPTLFLSGTWKFTDDEAVTHVAEIAEAYTKLFRSTQAPYAQIAFAKFPVGTEPGQWEAETRGRSVTIISSDMPFPSQSVQRLHEQLRHELFHLWIPNGLNLKGNYDWFYEGFALYQSLKLAVGMNRIRFEDFLDTLSRAHTIDSAIRPKVSLIEASVNRFAGANTQIYARGMLVAFQTDLALLERSGGKRSVENFLREFHERYRSGEPADANTAVLASLRANREVVPIVERYVTGTDPIDWANNIAVAGLEDAETGPITTLRVKERLSRSQKTLLDKLGYNNWRKLAR